MAAWCYLQLCTFLLLLSACCGAESQAASCHCAGSNSTYLTTAQPLTTTVTTASRPSATVHSASASPPADRAFILLNTSSQLIAAIAGLAFDSSTAGYTYDSSSNLFTLPAGAASPQLTIDLLLGPSGGICRPMPYLDQICISSICAGCNLNEFGAAAATTLADSLTQRIFYPTSIVNTTVCAGRDAFQRFGDFRYLVFLPSGSPSASQPYGFRVSISGNFSSYSCPSRRRRSPDILGDSIGSIDDDASSRFFLQLSRIRRAAPSDCSCPVGQDPVFSSVRIVLISWEFPLTPFSSSYSNTSSAEYMSLARESYYLLMDAVRNSTMSNLTSVVADFYAVEFSLAAPGVRMNGKMTVRNDVSYSDSLLLSQLKSILPEYGTKIQNLSLSSRTIINTVTPAGLPDYAVALICLLSVAAFAATFVLILWRLNLIGESASRLLSYKLPSPDMSNSSVAQAPNGASDQPVERSKALGSTIDGAVQMPQTAFLGPSGWQSAAASGECVSSS